MAESAKEAVRRGELKIIPEHHTKTWFHWMDNIKYVEQWKARQCL
jgi:Valyl-tRNA synthetase